MNVTQTITLDVAASRRTERVWAKQGDSGSRFVAVKLVRFGAPYSLPEGVTAHLRAEKADGTGIFNPAQITEEGLILAELTQQVLACGDTVHADICLMDADNNILSSMPFEIWVIPAPMGKNVLSTSEVLTLMDLIRRGEVLVEELGDAENGVVAQVADLLERVADLEYEPIAIVAVQDGGVHEMGVVLDSVTVSWVLNKEPARQHFNLQDIGADVREMVVEGPIDSDKVWLLELWDEREAKASASLSVTFFNGIYYGALAAGSEIDSGVIRGLSRRLQAGRGVSFTAGGDGKRPVYACPRRYGTPTFTIAGFEYSWDHVAAFYFVNASGYEEIYDVWMHGQDVSSAIRVAVT